MFVNFAEAHLQHKPCEQLLAKGSKTRVSPGRNSHADLKILYDDITLLIAWSNFSPTFDDFEIFFVPSFFFSIILVP